MGGNEVVVDGGCAIDVGEAMTVAAGSGAERAEAHSWLEELFFKYVAQVTLRSTLSVTYINYDIN